ncbi:MAG TPA: hypothetical protein VK174_15700 [Chitinophagales bacterium]|nr:hypothetical protein [Chitinophagales bacterium]HLP52973.1 hypothetical protein [Chitinophagales bacterium]
MKKILLMSALSIASFGVMNAQSATTTQSTTTTTTKQSPQARAKAMVSKITKSVGLQGDQWTKVNTLYVEYFTKLDVVSADAAKVKELDKTTATTLAGILTPSQLKLWQADSAK